MKLDELCLKVLLDVSNVLEIVDVNLIRIDYCNGEFVGSSGVFFENKSGEIEAVYPGDYQLSYEQMECLKEYLIEKRAEGVKANKLSITINSDKSHWIDLKWDQENSNVNEKYRKDSLSKSGTNITSSQTEKLKGDLERYTAFNSYSFKYQVLAFNVVELNITAELFVRAYSIFETKPEVALEGFMYSIRDNESGLVFGLGRIASGIGYFADNKDETTIKVIQEFNGLLFAEKISLKDCSLSFNHDFGELLIGFSEGEIYEIEKLKE